MRAVFLLAMVCVLLLLAGCAWFQPLDKEGMVQPSYQQISQEEAKRMMEQDDGHVIVDVRRRDEYDEGHIPGAVLIPNESIGDEPPELLPDKDQVILIYCRSGNRSKQAARKLADMGYTKVYEFGGIQDWTGPVISENWEAQVSKSVTLVVEANGRCLYAHLENNEAAAAWLKQLNSQSLTLEMQDHEGCAKSSPLPWELPRSDGEISARPGDLLLLEDGRIALCYDGYEGSFTLLARIEDKSREQLLEILGEGDVTVCFWLEWSE